MRRFYILLVLLFSFCFYFIILNTISYAYTWEDLVDHCSNISNSNVTFQDTITQANLIVTYSQQYLDLLANNNINVNDYHTFVTYKGTSSSSPNILILAKNTITVRYGYMVSGYRYPLSIQNLSNGVKINLNSKTIISTNASGSSEGGNASLGLVEGMTNFGNASFQYYANQYIYSDLLTTTLRGESPYLFAQGVVGYSLYNSNYGWYLIQNEEYTKLDEIQEDNDDFIMFGLLLTDEMLKNINKIDNCYLYYGDLTTKRYQSNAFLLDYELEPVIVPSGTITNTSGDVTGSIDLSGVESRLDSINQSIISGDSALLENQKENQSFWEVAYNSLFTMDSGDVNDVYLLVQSYFPSGDTPLTVYDTIFGAYGNEPDDFIIRWDDHPLNITWFGGQQLYSGDFIHAGYMNFSRECRDNNVLGNIKFWLNTLLTIFIFLAYYKFLYNCFCDMLGVVSEDIQEDAPEHRPIGFGRGDK